MQLHSLMGRIALLVLHFPRLRLIWSRSLHATAQIFHQLKSNQEEPDPVAGGAHGCVGRIFDSCVASGELAGAASSPASLSPCRSPAVARCCCFCRDCFAAATVGVPMEAGGGGPAGESVVNQSAIDLLRRLPGAPCRCVWGRFSLRGDSAALQTVPDAPFAPLAACLIATLVPPPSAGITEANWRAVMREAGSLAELAEVPLQRLEAAMGGQAAAKRLREFLDQDCQALFAAL